MPSLEGEESNANNIRNKKENMKKEIEILPKLFLRLMADLFGVEKLKFS